MSRSELALIAAMTLLILPRIDVDAADDPTDSTGRALAGSSGEDGKPARWNVLFIAVDDMNNDLGIYGLDAVKTPNLARLARRGTRFDRAYCQFPLCSPSRTSIMTGLRPNETRVFELRTHFRENVPDVVTLPQHFMRHGYRAIRVGKIYHYGNPGQIGTDGLDDRVSWHRALNPRGREKDEEQLLIDYTPNRGIGSSLNWMEAEGADEEQTDGRVATETVKLLEQHRETPFFIAAGFYRPHCPYVAPKKYFESYPVESIELPDEPADDLADVPDAAQWTRPPYWGLGELERKMTIRAYRATCSFVDAQVGRLLDALDRLDLWNSTVVVFWSDHGYNLSEHGQWKKQSLFEKSARVPLIIVAPGDEQVRGGVSPRTVELVDLYPTLADLCGLTIPVHCAGTSLRPLLSDPLRTWERPAYTQVWRRGFPGYSVRTERWRYSEWDHGKQGVELYDHAADAAEIYNLADDPRYRETRQRLAKLIQANWPEGGWKPEARKRGVPKKRRAKRAKTKD